MNRLILLFFFTASLISVMGKEKVVYLVQGVDLIDLVTGNIPKNTNVTLTKVNDMEMSPDGLYFEPEDDLNGPHLQFVKNITEPDADAKKLDVTTTAPNRGKIFAA